MWPGRGLNPGRAIMAVVKTTFLSFRPRCRRLKNDSSRRKMFMTKSLSNFAAPMAQFFSKLSTEASLVIVLFASTYLFESGFSAFMNIESKARNQLNVEDNLRLAITKMRPCIFTTCFQNSTAKIALSEYALK